ncbi:TPA: hypothetical protein N0F65_003352 [Lagenidium giganteum]|uniref:Uncharacterized protein n=1 Tax=Lagenidium giganteum TaxID=4803 RepID=A0AAV2ZB04_9STRA|nr:TPA: hypothetical protein N0F65_003352 [Lagenidium giganteum]
MHDHIDNYRYEVYGCLIAGFNGFDFVGQLTRTFLPGDIESVYRERALTAINDSTDRLDRLEALKCEVKRLQLL